MKTKGSDSNHHHHLLAGLSLLFLLLVGARGYAGTAYAATEAACTPQTQPFSVTAAAWGTSTSPLSVYPGDRNVPLTVTFLFSGPCSSPQASFILSLAQASNPTPFTGPDGTTQPKEIALDVSPNTFVTETFSLNVNQSAATGLTYHVPLIIEYDNNTASDVVTETTAVPIALYGPVSLSYTAATTHLLAEAMNNVTVSIVNSGSSISGPVSTSVAAPMGVTLLDQLATTSSIPPGGAATEVLRLFVASSLTGTAFTLTLTGMYLDAYSNSKNTTQSLGFYATSVPEPTLSIDAGGQPLEPGQTNEVVVSLANEGPGPASSIKTTVNAPAGFSVTSRLPQVASLPAGKSTDATLAVFAPSSSAGTAVTLTFAIEFTDQYGDSQSATLAAGLFVDSTSTPSLSFQAPDGPLVPGKVNTVPVTLSNKGAGSAEEIQTQVSGSGQSSVLAQFPFVASLSPGSSFTANVTVYVPESLGGSPVTLSVSASYEDGAGVVASTATQSIGLYVNSNSSASQSTSLSISPVADSVTTGTDSEVSYELKNIGNSTIYSPSFTFTVPQPLVVGENSTFSSIGVSLAPGQSEVFDAELTASPSSTTGIYQGTIEVGFDDQNGDSQTKSFSVPVTLSGSVVLVEQDEQVSQNGTDITVTGNILNEGSSPGDYSSVTGYIKGLNGSSQADYIGEIDVNTPVPFSVTIPYHAPNNPTDENVTLVVDYKNGLGEPANTSSTSSTRLLPNSEISTTSPGSGAPTHNGPNILELSILVTVVLVIVATAVVAVARRRGGKSAKSAVASGSKVT